MESRAKPALIEELALGQVPENERHGKASSQFYVWFSISMSIATVVIGALAIYLGNNLFWSLMAILVGNLVGAAFMAAHAAQGPILGVPQLIQSRGQFGYYLGAWLPVVLSLIMYVGFWAFGSVAAAQSLQEVFGGLSTTVAIILLGVVALVIAIMGYRYIHWTTRITTYVVAIALVILTVYSLGKGGLDWSTSGFSAGPWFLTVAIIAVYQISLGPYVSDYTRYLPKSVGVAKPFWWSYWGGALGGIWVMALGAIVTVEFPDLTTAGAIDGAISSGALAAFVLVVLSVGVIAINAMNLYGGMLALFTGASCFAKLEKGAVLRIVGITIVFAVSLWIALVASSNFLTGYQNFLTLLTYIFIPWSTINLIDFYSVKHGVYDVSAFFDRHGIYTRDPANRTYWGVNFNSAAAYAVGILAELPFMATAYYTGWWVDDLGGADISWLLGLTVPAVVYWVLARGSRVKAASVSESA
jgi:purine-cytosine permease-like protein